jgi:hypothetical protein
LLAAGLIEGAALRLLGETIVVGVGKVRSQAHPGHRLRDVMHA